MGCHQKGLTDCIAQMGESGKKGKRGERIFTVTSADLSLRCRKPQEAARLRAPRRSQTSQDRHRPWNRHGISRLIHTVIILIFKKKRKEKETHSHTEKPFYVQQYCVIIFSLS